MPISTITDSAANTSAAGDGAVLLQFDEGVSTLVGYFISPDDMTLAAIANSLKVNDVVAWEAKIGTNSQKDAASSIDFSNYFYFTVQRRTGVADGYNVYIVGLNMSGQYSNFRSAFINHVYITTNSLIIFNRTDDVLSSAKFKIEPAYAKLSIVERSSYSTGGTARVNTDQTHIAEYWEHDHPYFSEVVALRAAVDFNVLAASAKIAEAAEIVVSDIPNGRPQDVTVQYSSANPGYTHSLSDPSSDATNTWLDFVVQSDSDNLWRRPLIGTEFAADDETGLSPEMTRTIAVNVSVGNASDVIQFRRRFYGNYPEDGMSTAYTDVITGAVASSTQYAGAQDRLPLTVDEKRYFAAGEEFFLIGTVSLTHRLFPGERVVCSFLGDTTNVHSAGKVKFVNGELSWAGAAELDSSKSSQEINGLTAVNVLTSSEVNGQETSEDGTVSWQVWIKVTRTDLITAGGSYQADGNSNVVASDMRVKIKVLYGDEATQNIEKQLGDTTFGMFAYPTDGTLRVVGPAGAGRNPYDFNYGMIFPYSESSLEVAQFVQIPTSGTRSFSLADLHIRTGLEANAIESVSGYFTVTTWEGDEKDAVTLSEGQEAGNYEVLYTANGMYGGNYTGLQASSDGSFVNYTRFQYNTQNVSLYSTRFLYRVPSTQTKGTRYFRITFNDASMPDTTKSVLIAVHFVDATANWQRMYANTNPETKSAYPYLYEDADTKYSSKQEGDHVFAASFLLDTKQPDNIPRVPVRFVLAETNSGFPGGDEDDTVITELSAWSPSEFTDHYSVDFAFTFREASSGDPNTADNQQRSAQFLTPGADTYTEGEVSAYGDPVTKKVSFFTDGDLLTSGRLFLQSVIYGLADAEIDLVNNIVDPEPASLVLDAEASIPGYMKLRVNWSTGHVPNSDGAYKFALTATLGEDTHNLYFSSECKVADMEVWLEGLPDLAYSQEESSLGPMWLELRDAKLTSNWTPVQNARPITYTLYTAKVGEEMSLSSDNVLNTTGASSASFTMNVATQYAPFLRRPLEDGALQVITRNRQYMYTTRAVQYTTRNAGATGLNSAHLAEFQYDVFPPPTESQTSYIVTMGEIDQDAI